jgi:hypothetical protein
MGKAKAKVTARREVGMMLMWTPLLCTSLLGLE